MSPDELPSDRRSQANRLPPIPIGYSDLLESRLHPTLLLTDSFVVLYANHAFCEHFGWEREAIEKHDLFVISDTQWNVSRMREFLEKVLSPNATRELLDFDYETKTGGRRLLQCDAAQVAVGDHTFVVLSFDDYTSHRQLEDSLRESEQRSHTILTTAIDALVMIDERGRIKAFNPAAERLFGFTKDEVLGENVRVLMPAPYSDEHDTYVANYIRTGNKKVIGSGREVVGRRKDETTFPMELSVVELAWGSRRFFLGTVRDITNQKRAEEALRNSEARVRAVLDTAVDAIVTINDKGVVTSLNPAAQRMFGYNSEDVVGENVTMLMPPPYASEHDKYLRNYLETGRRRVIGIGREVVGLRRDGSTFPMELSVSEVVQGQRRTFTGIVRDISDRKRAETELKESHRIQEEARIAAMNADAAKSAFLANMSHEIRTPMTAILGYADMLLELEDPHEVRGAIETIQSSGRHLLEIINDILDLAKVEAGQLQIERSLVDPRAIIDDIFQLYGERAQLQGNTLTSENCGDVPRRVCTDALRLKQALSNLVSNAIKFTSGGEIRVLLEYLPSSQILRFHIQDTGIGLSEEQIGRLFQPFAQADSSTWREFGGTGLGLAITRRLAELLGGDVSVNSQIGGGSKFTLTISAGPVEVGETLLETKIIKRADVVNLPGQLQTLQGRVLLVEDRPDNQRLLSLLLRRAGAEVVIADDGQQGVEVALDAWRQQAPFGVILMDMQMPVLDGLAATRSLRDAGYPFPIVGLTAHAMQGDHEKCLIAGCDDCLSKPINRLTLISAVSAWMSKDGALVMERSHT